MQFATDPARHADDAAALAEFGARTFYETFATDNTPEDMAPAPGSRPGARNCSARKSQIPQLDTLLARR